MVDPSGLTILAKCTGVSENTLTKFVFFGVFLVLSFKIWLFFGESEVGTGAGDFGAVKGLAQSQQNIQARFRFKSS